MPHHTLLGLALSAAVFALPALAQIDAAEEAPGDEGVPTLPAAPDKVCFELCCVEGGILECVDDVPIPDPGVGPTIAASPEGEGFATGTRMEAMAVEEAAEADETMAITAPPEAAAGG